MDDGHVGAEFLRKNEEYEHGIVDNVMFGSKTKEHVLYPGTLHNTISSSTAS